MPIGHFFSRRPPNTRKGFGVFDKFTNSTNAIGTTGNVRMQANVHNASLAFPLFIQHI
ncbi:DUF4092 domain-containing protein [Alteromonas sp. C1M14]|uniref:DUF4092 domain-containing protein n=1 Tax=Alteromonas sp. C1M14 TaxID=2841567 RepID=UPI001C099E71|nr:DUF4092 domain-containing protein [Alteromonas sp. C1M14]